MLCPFCREKDTSVVDSRPTEDGTAIRRRRLCGCERKERFTTFERVQFQELTVIKGNGKREPFDRDKISKSIRIATRKRPIDSETIEKFISKIKIITKKPVCVGFGISTKKHVKDLKKQANGIVIGSAIIKIIEENLNKNSTMITKLSKFISSIKKSTFY